MQILLSQKEFLAISKALEQVPALMSEVQRLAKQIEGLWSMYSELLEKIRELDSLV